VTLASVAGTEPANVALAVNSAGVYVGGGGSGIVRVPKGGGTVSTLASSEPGTTSSMTVDEEAPSVIAVDATSVYWGTDNLTPPYAGATIKRLTPK